MALDIATLFAPYASWPGQSVPSYSADKTIPASTPKRSDLLRDAVARQCAGLTAELAPDFAGRPEPVPGKPTAADYDRYDVAHAAALRNCNHPDIHEILYDRQWQCQTCRRYFDRTTFPRIGFSF